MNAFNNYFLNATEVVNVVLVNITLPASREMVYNDTEYGMYSGKALTVWVAASLENAGAFIGWTVSPK